jgi:autotransporter-associated beta strand protein
MKHSILLIAPIAMCGLFVTGNPANAQSFWDPAHHQASPGSGGAGLWNNTTANWWVSGSADVPWTPDNTAVFEGSAGNITLGTSVTASGLTFTAGGYELGPPSTPLVLTLSGTAPIITVPAGNTTIYCALAGTSGLIENGPGTLMLYGTNTYGGDTYINSGTLTLSLQGQLGSGNYAGNLFNFGAFNFSSQQNQTLSGVISGTGTLTTGPGTLTLGGVNTYTGNTTINSFGTLIINSTGQLGSGDYPGNLFINGGTFNYRSTNNQILSGTISGIGALTQNGPGTLTLSRSDTYRGNTTIGSGATLALTGSGSIYDTTLITINENATFDVSANPTFSLGYQPTLSASGTASHATINGTSGGTVSLGSQPIILTYDGSHPALSISQGTLLLSGNAVTINTVSPLGLGAYIVAQQATGNIISGGNFSVAGSAVGLDKTGSISASGGSLILTIQNSTSTALSVSGSPTSYGGLLTFQATVSPAPVDGEIITFMDGVAVIGTGLTTGGVAMLPINTLAAGSHSITAVYPGDTSNAGSTSSLLLQAVSKATPTITSLPTATSITYGQTLAGSTLSGGAASTAGSFAFTTPATSPNAGTANQGVTFTPADMTDYNTAATTVSVTVSPATPIVTVAVGSYTYNGSAQGPDTATKSTTDSGAVTWSYVGASYSSSSLPVSAGNYTATATVAADGNNNSASSSATPFIINQQTNAVLLISSVNPSSQGQSVTFTAAVQVNGLTRSDATSNVVFLVDTVPMVTNVLAGGQTAYSTSTLAVGGHSILAEYTGDNNYTASTNSPALMQTVALPVITPVLPTSQTLYVISGGNRLYQFDIAAGAASGTPVAGASGLAAQAMAVDGSGNLFIATYGDQTTDFGDLYELATNGVLQTIATGLNYPTCLAVDSYGNLFEGEADLAYLNEFVNTAGALSSTPVSFGSGLSDPTSLAFDASGDLFELDTGTYSVLEFTINAGSLSPLPSSFGGGSFLAFDNSGDLLTYPGFEYVDYAGVLTVAYNGVFTNPACVWANFLAFDSHDDLFYVDCTGNVNELANQAGTLSSTPALFAANSAFAGGAYELAFVPAAPQARMFVAGSASGDEQIYTLDPAVGIASLRTIADSLSYVPLAMAADLHGNLFVADGISTIYEIPRGGLPITFVTGLNGPGALAFDNNGDLFESDVVTGLINEFTNNAGALSSNPTAFQNLGSSVALAFDHHGDLFMGPQSSAYGLVEFASQGGTLLNSAMGLNNSIADPTSLAIDGGGNVFGGFPNGQLTSGSGAILENANSNAAAGWFTGEIVASTPATFAAINAASLTFDNNGNLFVADGDDGSIQEFTAQAGTLSSTPVLFASGLNATCVAVNMGPVPPPAGPPDLYLVGCNGANADVIYAFNTTNGPASQILVLGMTNDKSANGNISYHGSLGFDSSGNLLTSGDYIPAVSDVYEMTNNAGILSTDQAPLGFPTYHCNGGFLADNEGQLIVQGADNGADVLTRFSSTTTYYNPTFGSGLGGASVWAEDGVYVTGDAFIARNMALDSTGTNLFVAAGNIVEYTNALEMTPHDTSIPPIYPFFFGMIAGDNCTCVAFDANGNLFAGYVNANAGFIYEYTNMATGISPNPTLFASSLGVVTALGFDAAGDLFEAETDTGRLNEFINYNGNFTPYPVVFASGLCAPQALAFFPGTGVAFAQTVSTPGGPTLAVTYTPPSYAQDRGTIPGNIVVSWPSNGSSGPVIQTSPSLAPAVWSDYGGNVISSQGINTVTIPVASTGNLFIRLAPSGSSY